MEEAEVGLKLLQAEEWDLFFITFSWLDTIQHLFWRYMDESDPAYPGPNPHQDVIRETYRLLDRIVGDFVADSPEAVTIVLSDHGHGMRPPRTVNVNEFLRRDGYLVSKGHTLSPIPYLIETMKHRFLDLVHRFDLEPYLLRLTKTAMLSSVSKSVYMSSASIDLERSKAYLSSFAGPKSYTHGGLEINREALGANDYESFRAELIHALSNLHHPDTGEDLMEWVCAREDLYSGSFASTCYPDVVSHLFIITLCLNILHVANHYTVLEKVWYAFAKHSLAGA